MTNVLFLAEGPRIENFAVIAGTIVGVPALLIAIWWCVRYLEQGFFGKDCLRQLLATVENINNVKSYLVLFTN